MSLQFDARSKRRLRKAADNKASEEAEDLAKVLQYEEKEREMKTARLLLDAAATAKKTVVETSASTTSGLDRPQPSTVCAQSLFFCLYTLYCMSYRCACPNVFANAYL